MWRFAYCIFLIALFHQCLWRSRSLGNTKNIPANFLFFYECAKISAITPVFVCNHGTGIDPTWNFKKCGQPISKNHPCVWPGTFILFCSSFNDTAHSTNYHLPNQEHAIRRNEWSKRSIVKIQCTRRRIFFIDSIRYLAIHFDHHVSALQKI